MLKRVFIVIALALSVTPSFAKAPAVSFSSAYTHLSRECKWAYSQSELAEGQDNALLCKGFGRYRIFLYFSAMDSWLSIRLKGATETAVLDPAIGGIDEKEDVVEWRMANKVPFAVIVRSREYSGPEADRKLIKESLVVRGIDKYAEISGSVTFRKDINANEEARRLADEGYRKIHSSGR